MPLLVELQDEFGTPIEELDDPQYLLGKMLPLGDRSFRFLSYVDLWGDTVFNQLQMGPVLAELAQIMPRADTAEQRELLQQLQELARRCQDGTHLYLKFEGD